MRPSPMTQYPTLRPPPPWASPFTSGSICAASPKAPHLKTPPPCQSHQHFSDHQFLAPPNQRILPCFTSDLIEPKHPPQACHNDLLSLGHPMYHVALC